MTVDRPVPCESCGQPLCGRGRAVTGLCFDCRRAGSAFLAGWLRSLRVAGSTMREAAEVAGVSEATARARLNDARLRTGA